MEFVSLEENVQVREILKSNDNNLNKLINLRNLIYNNFNMFVKYQCKINNVNEYRNEIKAAYEEIENLKKMPYSFNNEDFEKVFKSQKIIKLYHTYDKFIKSGDLKIYLDEFTPLDVKAFENIERQILERDNKIDELYKKINRYKDLLQCPQYKFVIFLSEKLDDYIDKIKELNDGVIPKFIEKDEELDKIIGDLNYSAFISRKTISVK